MWPEVPENEVVASAIARKPVSLGHQRSCKCLEQLSGQGINLVVVKRALHGWEDRHIDLLLDVWIRLGVPEKDHHRTRNKPRRVGSDRDDIGLLERRKVLLVAINAEIGATSVMSSAPSWSVFFLSFPGSTTRGRQKHRT